MAGRRGVDDHALEAVVVHVLQEQAHGRGLVGTRHRSRERVRVVAAQQLFETAEIAVHPQRPLTDGGLRVDLGGVQREVLADPGGLGGDLGPERVRQGVCRVGRDDQRRRAVAGARKCRCRGTGGLADAAFAAVEDVVRRVDTGRRVDLFDRLDVEVAHTWRYTVPSLRLSTG